MWLKGIDKKDYPVTGPKVRESFTQDVNGRFVEYTRTVAIKIKQVVFNKHKIPLVNWFIVPGGYLSEVDERLKVRGHESCYLLKRINELHERLRRYES